MILKNKQDIEKWLQKNHIRNYTIRENLIVDVDSDVGLYNIGLSSIPIQFGIVNGYFECSHNNLYSLKGCPREVNGDACFNHNCLISLEYCPTFIKRDFMLYDNPILDINLQEFPQEIGGDICLGNKEFDLCSKIKSLEELYNNKGTLVSTLQSIKSHVLKNSLENKLNIKISQSKLKI